MKRLVSSVSALALALSLAQPALAQDAFNPELIPVPQTSATFIVGETGVALNASSLGATSRNGEEQWTCDGAVDPECADSKISLVRGIGIVPVCESDTDVNCVVSLEITNSEGIFEPATFIRYAKGMEFEENARAGFFEQTTPSLWDAPHAPTASGLTKYSVVVAVSQYREPGKPRFQTESFIASVFPYREQTGNYESPYQFTLVGKNPVTGREGRSLAGGGGGYDCGWIEDGTCGVVQDFADGTKVKLTIRISKTVGGWFQGRIKNPQISVRDFSATHNEVSVEAEPAIVQRLHHVIEDAKSLTSKEKSLVRGFAGSWDGFITWANSSDWTGFEFVDYFRPKVKDTAAGQNSFWNFSSTMYPGEGSRCLADKSKVLGIVTTNAMVYDGGVPKFTRGFLNYKVAGLHFQADGATEVLGTYDLVMRSDVARCLYGFSRAPVSATISIAGDGDRNIATTVVGEKNGWLKLAAYGFTFSEKTIRVKITQPKRTTITCVSTSAPTKTRKVSGINPTCPAGFKKR